MNGRTTVIHRGADGLAAAGADGNMLQSVEEFESQEASSFLVGWLRTARLALTGATSSQLLTKDRGINSHYVSISTEESDDDGDGDTIWEPELLLETGEPASELLLLPRGEELVMRNAPETESGFKPSAFGFGRWPAKGNAALLSGGVAVEESESFLLRRGAKRINDAEVADHPFGFARQGRESSSFLIRSS